MRSQMAEAFYNYLTDTDDATSAGAGTRNGRDIDPDVVKVMAAKGINVADKKSTELTQEMFNSADKVIWFPTSFMPDYVKGSHKAEFWDVSDPWYEPETSDDFMAQTADKIEVRVKKLIEGAK
ncbi:low molecular weight phosphatase family protein [Candidatus Nomurabacteria bacterium]|nr:low molecular weight phosphatase family protein [Candidatus Nomurabacteria bacterium]